MDPTLLTPDDPLFEPVKRRAATGELESLRWLLDSAKEWARAEFARRLRKDDFDWLEDLTQIEERVEMARRKQCAVLVEWGAQGDRIFVGMCAPDARGDYVRMQTAGGDYIGGVGKVLDMMRLPPEWTVTPWPYELLTNEEAARRQVKPPEPEERKLPTRPPRACGDCWGWPWPDKSHCTKCGGTGMLRLIGDIATDQDGMTQAWDGKKWLLVRKTEAQDGKIVCTCEGGVVVTVRT